MNLNLSFFKRTFITGVGLAIVAGAGMAFFAHANAVQNNQTTTHGAGFVAGMVSSPGKLTKVNRIPLNPPNVCGSAAEANLKCRCPQMGLYCVKCPAVNAQFCVACPSSPKMMIACRVINNDGNGQNNPPPTAGAPVSGSSDSSGSGSQSTNSTQLTNSGGNTTGLDNPQPSPTPINATCPSNPRIMIACQAGGNPNCPYLEVCRVDQ